MIGVVGRSDDPVVRQDVPDGRSAEPAEAYRVEHVSVSYPTDDGPVEVLKDIDFQCERSEIVGIVGRSGTGKTTLMRVLSGLLAATSGTVRLRGALVEDSSADVVTVFQDYANALLPWRSVERNVALPLERMARSARRERVQEALDLVGLGDRGSSYPWQLSGGMQQRVQIARALAVRPQVLLMDEPFGALDAMTKATLQDEMLKVRESTRATILFITHDLDEAIYLSDRVLVIAGSPGRITQNVVTELPMPRDQILTRESLRYLELRHQLASAIRNDRGEPA